ncbi:hypothetical protein [Streptomyces cyaneofuscatus]|uniref:hypothetical protein n=1 Tax=Streptomyces cyaneofuscatus TaxID=66883 RepID=UPI0037A94EA4
MRMVPNRRGIASFLRSAETRELIERKTRAAERAAAADGGQFRTDVETGDLRVRGAVIGDYESDSMEETRARLLRGLDGARGAD